jgi:hypothetical protein
VRKDEAGKKDEGRKGKGARGPQLKKLYLEAATNFRMKI